jgi:hypothetical protein
MPLILTKGSHPHPKKKLGDVLNIDIALLITKKVEGHAFNIN